MPKAARLNDIGSGHGCFPPTNITAASHNVQINNRPAARQGDPLAAHGCSKCSPHARAIAAGSPSVFINGIPAARLGDPITCGGGIITASDDVFIGDFAAGNSGGILQQALGSANDSVKMLQSMRRTLLTASQQGQPFCLPCQQAKAKAAERAKA